MLDHVGVEPPDASQLCGLSSISMPILPAAISRSAITVVLSRSLSTSGCDPALIWRARLVAASVSSKRLGILTRQSSIVIRAMALPCVPGSEVAGTLNKLCNQSTVADALLRRTQARSPHDGAQVVDRGGKVLINNNIIELGAMTDLVARGFEAPGYRRLVILAAPVQPLLEQRERRRQDEDVDRRRDQAAHLGRALPVDFQQDVLTRCDLLVEPARRGRVPVAVDVRVLEKFAGVAQRHEALGRHEVVIDAVLLAGTRRARRI